MPALPPELDFARDPAASPARVNRAMLYLWSAILALQAPGRSLDAELAQVQAIALQRVDDMLQPLFAAVSGLASLGVLFNAASSTPNAIATGPAAFVLSATDRDRFNFSGFQMAVSQADSRNSLVGRFVSYDRPTGRLVLDIMVATGDPTATPSDWMIMPGPAPFAPIAVLDGGSDDGNALQTIPYRQDITPDSLAAQMVGLPRAPDGLTAGQVWLNGGMLTVVLDDANVAAAGAVIPQYLTLDTLTALVGGLPTAPDGLPPGTLWRNGPLVAVVQ